MTTSYDVIHSARFGNQKIQSFQNPLGAPSLAYAEEVLDEHQVADKELKQRVVAKTSAGHPHVNPSSGIPNAMETKRSAHDNNIGFLVDTVRTSSSNREEYVSMAKNNSASAAAPMKNSAMKTKAQDYKTHSKIVNGEARVADSRKHKITVPDMATERSTRNTFVGKGDYSATTMEKHVEEVDSEPKNASNNKLSQQSSRKLSTNN